MHRRQTLIPIATLLLLLAVGCRGAQESPQILTPTPQAVAVTAISNAATVTSSPEVRPTIFRVPTLIPTPTSTPIPTRTPTATPPRRVVEPAADGIWVSASELATLPMEGEAWERLLETADGSLEEPNIAGLDANHDVQTLAVALVYARTGDLNYREKAAQAIRATMGTEFTGLLDGPGSSQGATAESLGRNLASYVIAADLIGLENYDATLDAEFRTWISRLLTEQWEDGSLVAVSEQRPSSIGRTAGASRAAVAAYLGDPLELERAARVFKGFLGDRHTYASFQYGNDLSWQHVRLRPVGVNPAGASKDGFSIDGAMPEEMRRGCSFQVPPCPTTSPWGSLQGIVVEANILHRQGYDTWNWEDGAVLRAVQFMDTLQQRYPGAQWWATGDDRWVPWLVNDVYGASFPTEETRMGKNMGWTDWTHAP